MSARTKVLQVIGGMYLGGAERVVYNIAKNTNQDEFEVSIYCTHGSGELGDELRNDGYQVDVLGRGAGIFTTLLKIKKHIDILKPDVIHTHSVSGFLAIAPLYVVCKMPPWVHTFHFGNYPHIKKSYLYSKRFLNRFASKLVTVSNSQRQSVITHLYVKPDNVITIFNGVKENAYLGNEEVRQRLRQEFGFVEEDIVLSCIVVLTVQKGVSFLLEAMDRIVANNSHIKLLIVGGGPLENELRDMASKLSCSQSIVFAGWRKDIPQIMTAIDIFTLPSLWEGLPMVLLEAMSSSRPVVVTDVADNIDVVGDKAGYVVPPANSTALVEGICKLASDFNTRKTMGDIALQRYRAKYTITEMVSSYENLYRDLISMHRTSK